MIGALPPYNYLLGGKLISYLLASREVREIFEKKYKESKYNKLAGIFTTSLYGRSSQYNRIRFQDRLLYNPIGFTKGYGTLHFTNETFNAMNELLKSREILVSNRLGDGPSWSMRVIRSAGALLGFDANVLLKHSFRRKIYYVSLAKNSLNFLNGETRELQSYESGTKTLTDYWKRRWLSKRIANPKIVEEVKWVHKDFFEL